MSSGQAQCGALAAKVHALYGKRLSQAELRQLAEMKQPADILEFLRQHPGWSRALSQAAVGSWNYVGRIEVERALREELLLEYLGLANFVPKEDRPLMACRVRAAERTAILNTLRRLKTAGKYAKGMPPAPRIVLRGKLDYEGLKSCTNYDGLLEAAKDSIYYHTLRHLRPEEEGQLPDYTLADSLLHAAYYAHQFRLVQGNYQGAQRQQLLDVLGERVDLRNALALLRLKTYFPDTPPQVCLSMLYPFNHHLSPQLLRELCAAPDGATVAAGLADTPYAQCFAGGDPVQAEAACQGRIYRRNRRQVRAGPPGVYTAIAYLELKELEMKALINVVESVKYGVPPDMGLIELVGA